MSLAITVSDAVQLEDRIWLIGMPPHQVRLFGEPRHAEGPRSVILLKKASFNKQERSLHFDADDVVALNIGTQPYAVVIGGFRDSSEDAKSQTKEKKQDDEKRLVFGRGDREFLELAKILPPDMQEVAKSLLIGVRQRSPGDLKRGKTRNFSETPDNFWYVKIQPRVADLSITVRGPVSHFEGLTNLAVKDDRGNTLFKVTGQHDVADALKLIFHAKRKY